MDTEDRMVHVSQSLASAMPVLTITPALSGSASDFEDENTPLVSEVSGSTREIGVM